MSHCVLAGLISQSKPAVPTATASEQPRPGPAGERRASGADPAALKAAREEKAPRVRQARKASSANHAYVSRICSTGVLQVTNLLSGPRARRRATAARITRSGEAGGSLDGKRRRRRARQRDPARGTNAMRQLRPPRAERRTRAGPAASRNHTGAPRKRMRGGTCRRGDEQKPCGTRRAGASSEVASGADVAAQRVAVRSQARRRAGAGADRSEAATVRRRTSGFENTAAPAQRTSRTNQRPAHSGRPLRDAAGREPHWKTGRKPHPRNPRSSAAERYRKHAGRVPQRGPLSRRGDGLKGAHGASFSRNPRPVATDRDRKLRLRNPRTRCHLTKAHETPVRTRQS